MKRLLLAILFLSSVFAGAGRTLSLRECVSLGIANNLSLLNARIDIDKGRNGVSENRAQLLPVITGVVQFTDYLSRPVNVTTGTLLGSDFPEDPTWQTIRSMQYNVTAGVQLTMPLYNQSLYAAIDVARTVEWLGHLSYDRAVEDLTVQIGKVYCLAQTSLELSRLTEENIARMRALCAITEALHGQGVVLGIDVSRAGISLKNLVAAQDEHAVMYARQIDMLRFLLDLPPEEPVEVERIDGDIEPLLTSGVSASLPELRQAEAQRELAARRISAVRAGYLPTLSLTGYAGGLGYQERFGHFFHTADASRNWFGNCFVGVSLTVPLFDADSRRLRIRRHRYEAAQADNTASLLRASLDREYSDALMRMDHSLEVYRTQSESYRQACDVYDVTAEPYREGVASMTALLQDEMQLRTAQSACVQARCQFSLARIDLLRLSGNLSQLTGN